MLPFEDRAGLAEAAASALRAWATRPATLEELLRTEARIVDVVVQDEYTHDVVAAVEGGLFLVYDCT